jgi:RNA polymerase sigma-70 factor (ECF subfamily)
MNSPNDQNLFSQIKKNNHQALTTLFHRYYQHICRFIYLFIPENETAEELSANVFIKLWENRNKITIQNTLRSYLYQSAKNQALSQLRKKKISLQSWTDGLDVSEKKDQTPEAIFIGNELNDEFIRTFRQIPQRAQLAFKLHRFDDLSYKEIATIMNISISAVEKNITSALKILHRELIQKKILF